MAVRRKKSDAALVPMPFKSGSLPATLEEYAELAAAQAHTVESFSARQISVMGGQFQLGRDETLGDTIEVVILTTAHYNVFYAADFDPDVVRGATCFAVGHDRKTLAPPDGFDGEAESCAVCPQHSWGSGDRGVGRACKEQERLLVAFASDLVGTDQSIDDVPTYLFSTSVTNVKHWREYADMLVKKTKLPTYAVITEITVSPHAKNQHELTFRPVSVFDIDVVKATIVPWVEKHAESVLAAPNLDDGSNPAPPKKAKRGRPATRSKTAARKNARKKGARR